MLNKLKTFLTEAGVVRANGAPPDDAECARFAAAVLLAEAGLMDGSLDADEQAAIVALLGRRFELPQAEALALLDRALEKAQAGTELFGHTRIVKDSFTAAERIELMEMLWEVVYADGELHDYEANLMRRLAGLLHVEDQDSGKARKRAMGRLGLA